MNMFWYKWTKRFEGEKRVLKNGRSSSGKQYWSKFASEKNRFYQWCSRKVSKLLEKDRIRR